MSEPTPNEIELSKRARKLCIEVGFMAPVVLEGVSVVYSFSGPDRTTFLTVRYDDSIVYKEIDGKRWADATWHEQLPAVLAVLRKNMVLDDIAEA